MQVAEVSINAANDEVITRNFPQAFDLERTYSE